ncbi:MAG: DegV family protein [Acidimicrobiia bacterium]
MGSVHIVTDSACDLPPENIAGKPVTVVPLTIRFGGDEFVDRKDLTPKEFWSKVKASPVLPETAAPPPGAFEQAYRDAIGAGAEGIVCITLSGDLSATYQSAELAAKSITDVPIRVVDSKSITMGLGFMGLAALEAAEAGKGVDDVAGAVEDLIPRSYVYGCLDTLDNLKKGGRIGGAQAFLGSLLSIKPIINISSGVVEEEAKQRTRAKSLKYLADKVNSAGEVERLAVMHGSAPDVDLLIDLLATNFPRDQIVVGEIGAVIGAHGGPGVVGVSYVTA